MKKKIFIFSVVIAALSAVFYKLTRKKKCYADVYSKKEN